MGMYDSVKLHCPFCNKVYYAQSKGGECNFDDFTLENAPEDVLSDVNRHAPFECPKCKTKFQVEFVPKEVRIK